MKAHTKIYFDHFGIDYDPATGWHDHIECEVQEEGCQGEAVDIMHIEPRRMGGNPNGSKDRIENLMAGCRSCHEKTEGIMIEELQRRHNLKLNA